MKKILFLLLCTVSMYGQTLQNPTFGNTTTNTIKVKTNSTSTTALDVGVLETDGSLNKMTPTNLLIPQVPLNYSVLIPSIGGHLSGIDLKLGALSGTTAGISTRVWFTADQTTITAGTFDLTNPTSKGTVASHQQTVANDDGQKKYFTTDLIGQPFAMVTTFPAGTYAGSLSASTTPTNANQKFTVELYRCNNAGTPIASGVTGAVVGDLGVTTIMIMDSGEVTLANASITNVPVSTNLGAGGFTINAGERIRYHVSAEKVGTAGGVINESVYYGTSYNSFIDVPVIYNSTSIKDVSTVTNGTGTVTDALNYLNADTKSIYRSNVATSSASNKRNDQSSMLRLNDGRLAIAYSRFGVAVGDIDPVSIYVRFSSDNGKTWTSESELIPTTALGVMIPSMYKKSNGNILITYFVREQTTPSNLSSIRKIEFNPTLTSIVTASSIIVASGGYTPIASDRLHFDSVSNRLLLPYPILISGAGSSGVSVYNTKILVSSNEGTSWTDSGLTINGFTDISGFGGALEPGIFENKGKITVYSRNLIGSVGACDLTWGGSSYSKGTEYKLNLKSMNSQSSIKYSSFLKGWVASVTRLYDQPTSSERRQIDLLFSKDLTEFLSLYTLEDITQTAGYMALEPNIFIDDKVYVSYSYAPISTDYDLKNISFPFSVFSNTETKTFKSFVTNPDSSNANEIANSEISLTPSFDASRFGNIVRNKITVKDNIAVTSPAINSFYSNITYQNIVNTSVGVKTLNLGVISAFSPQQEIDNVRLLGEVSRIYVPPFTSSSLKNSAIIDKYSAIQIPRILDALAGGTITDKYAINQEYIGDVSTFMGKVGFGNNTPSAQVSAGVAITSPAAFGGTVVAGNIGTVYASTLEQVGGLELPGNANYGAKLIYNNTTDSYILGTRASSTTWTERFSVSALTGVAKINNLAGTGTRQVVADASGNLSATDAAPTSGTYTPTLTNTLNVSGATLSNATYTKVGNIVTVSVSFTVTATLASTLSQVKVSLPVTRTPATTIRVGNLTTVEAVTSSYNSGVVDATNTTEVTLYFKSISAANYAIVASFQYSII